ncbi:MAG: DUF1292 domain-containing protein [Clostridia bacterium]|nr:DUF1292 domain-containing protein [Clostridia bacterium]
MKKPFENDDYIDEDIITILDENKNPFYFLELDRIETETGKYIAMTSMDEESSENEEEYDEVIIVKVTADGKALIEIKDETELKEITELFEERLSEKYDLE